MTQTAGASNARALPTAKRIRSELQLLLGRAEAGDTVLVAFAGHGVQFKGEQGAFFCPMDAALDDRETLIPLAEVYAALEKCPARTKVLLVDACRNEVATPLRRAVGGVELEAVGKPQAVKLPTGVASFFSCDAGQFAYEHPDLKHGVFFHFVLKGLRGEADLNKDQAIELTELDLFVRKAVKDFVAVELGQLQSPRLITTLDGTPVLVVLDRRVTPSPMPTNPMARPTVPRPPRSLPPANAPALAIAPFTAEEAKQHQQAWASYLRVQPVTTNSVSMKLALIPPGEFLMGSPEGEKARNLYETQHIVRITKPFYMGVYEVTQAEYKAIIGSNPSAFAATGNYSNRVLGLNTTRFPVDYISWDDATEFCRRLSQKEGKTYRLPTEAEWEYACRAGTTTPFHFGSVLDGDKANVNGNFPYGTTTKGRYMERTTTVGSFAPNGFGLYDLHGNVWEWCGDWYGNTYYDSLTGSTTENPMGEEAGTARVLRGGSWYNFAEHCRSADRIGNSPVSRNSLDGFRVVLGVISP